MALLVIVNYFKGKINVWKRAPFLFYLETKLIKNDTQK